MNLIYIHGLDSDANSTKGLLLDEYCRRHHPDIIVHRPDLNQPPQGVFDKVVKLVAELDADSKVVLVGSSLGGYFASLVSNHTGCPALLLNPSIQPHVTLQRFCDEGDSDRIIDKDEVIHSTAGGWIMTKADLNWFTEHQLQAIHYSDKVAVFIKQGDELLNANLSATFYRQQGAIVTLQAGGDHRFSDFSQHLPRVIKTLKQLG